MGKPPARRVVIDELFDFAGFKRSDYLNFVPIDPICRYFFSDGSVMDASADKAKMKAAIAELSSDDGEAYTRFLKYAERIHDLAAEIFMFTPTHEFGKLMRLRYFRTLFRLHQIDPFRTVHQSVSRFFSDPRLVQPINTILKLCLVSRYSQRNHNMRSIQLLKFTVAS